MSGGGGEGDNNYFVCCSSCLIFSLVHSFTGIFFHGFTVHDQHQIHDFKILKSHFHDFTDRQRAFHGSRQPMEGVVRRWRFNLRHRLRSSNDAHAISTRFSMEYHGSVGEEGRLCSVVCVFVATFLLSKRHSEVRKFLSTHFFIRNLSSWVALQNFLKIPEF